MAPNTSFESLSFVFFSTEENYISNKHDPDVNYYNDAFTIDKKYLASDKLQRNFKSFSVALYLTSESMRSINKKFEDLKVGLPPSKKIFVLFVSMKAL